ncbi:histidinol-phosphatase [Taurinivorans muris]|jgi:histidinol phosphate phosphatase HisJ family|uniref:Histidinol-phosphatase n=1 Tax=Taurinivorans muris TaxID=2787751 RepID=A0ABY5Y3J8_9BACT|nr:histidinol-phosphatase [Desulfovibrionaceae bacterium LT0009]HBV41111.1 histidinol-phosphatase [Desulfovibrio sp.]
MLIDLHTHTCYGHGSNTVFEMFQAGRRAGLDVHGFSEHSPRPSGYDYTNEYREHLNKHFQDYLDEVEKIKQERKENKILLALELDWLEDEPDFMQECMERHSFDYVIAGIHFIKKWGFDDQASHWVNLSKQEKHAYYAAYYKTMIKMAESKLFHIVAHPDLIKIFSRETFAEWIKNNKSLAEDALLACKENKLCMEISSAGLRKPCQEIYPCRTLMEIAKDIDIPITFASDGHCVNTIAKNIGMLHEYAKEYGFTEQNYFENNTQITVAL